MTTLVAVGQDELGLPRVRRSMGKIVDGRPPRPIYIYIFAHDSGVIRLRA